MNRLKNAFLLACAIVLLAAGCVTRTAHLTPHRVPGAQTVKPSSLSDYIRGVYKLSAEASQQLEQRAALLADAPELEGLVQRLEQMPGDTEARSLLVNEYMSRKLYWGAYELLTDALPSNPNDPETNLSLAVIWDAWGLFDLAQQYAERAIANGAHSARAYETIGRVELHRLHPTEAALWFDSSLDKARTAPVLANLGYAHMLKSDWDSARARLEEATQLDDTLEEAHNNLAIVLSKTGNTGGALAHLLRASRPAVAFNNMGVLYLQEKNLSDAQHFFEESLRLEPEYDVARRNLAALNALRPPAPAIIQLPAAVNDAESLNTGSSGLEQVRETGTAN